MSTRTPTARPRPASADRPAAADSAVPIGQTLRFGRKQLNLSNLQKVLYAEAGFTKGDVIRYYLSMAHALLPHLKNRALTLKRYPNGSDGMFFYEKNCPVHRPPWVDTARVASRRREEGVNYCLVNDAATLAWV